MAPISILVVDDVPEIGLVLKLAAERILGRTARVTTVSSSAEALALLGSETFDLVLTDYAMPGANGLDVLRRARSANPSAFRWLMTGFNELPCSLGEAREAGIDALVRKPVGSATLGRMLTGTLGGDTTLIQSLRADVEEMLGGEARVEHVDGETGALA